MTRSRKKNPFHGVAGESEKIDKKEWHGRLRAHERDMIHIGNFECIPDVKEVSNPWDMNKDGKIRFDPKRYPEGMRK